MIQHRYYCKGNRNWYTKTENKWKPRKRPVNQRILYEFSDLLIPEPMSLWKMQFPGKFPLPWSKSIVLIPIPKKGNNTDSKISFNWLFSSHLDDFNKNYTYMCERNTLSIVINYRGKYHWFLIVRYHSLSKCRKRGGVHF